MTPRALALLLTVAAVVPVRGDAPPDTAGYHLKNRSIFNSPETTRPPFWPVGWVKQGMNSAPVADVAPVVSTTIDPDQFSVTSILLGSPSLAVINGKAYSEGEYLRPSRSKTPTTSAIPAGARIRVQRITDGHVMLQAANQVVTVTLRRPQLSEHKADDDLPSINDR